MKTFIASVCAVGVVGVLTAAAATTGTVPSARQEARQDRPAKILAKIDVNRVGKTDRWSLPKAGTILVRTISIRAHRQEEAAARELTACESVVSPLADRVASRRARQCAT
jgi:hypothetical protein